MLTERDLISQGYTADHAAQYAAMLRERRALADATTAPLSVASEGKSRARRPAAEAQRQATAEVLGIAPPAAATEQAAPTNAELRSWAEGQGITLKPRGRVPAAVFRAYADAHP